MNGSKRLDALSLYEEAQVLIKDKGYIWSHGRLNGKQNEKRVVSYLAEKYAVSTRWISDCLRRGRAISQGEPAPATSLVGRNRRGYRRNDKRVLIFKILGAKKWTRKATALANMLVMALDGKNPMNARP